MIQPLRALHRAAFGVLALGLPTLLVAALRARHAPPVQALGPELRPSPSEPLPAGEDWLVYWVDEQWGDEGLPTPGQLPEDAELAGTRRSGALEREPPPGKRALAYSLLEGRIVGADEPPRGARE